MNEQFIKGSAKEESSSYYFLSKYFKILIQLFFSVSYFISYCYSTADSTEKNLFTVKNMASSEMSNSWSFDSKSKDFLQADIDRMKGLHVSFKWKDQGWGGQKGRIAVNVMNGTDEVFHIEDWGVAPHIEETVSVMYDEDHYFVKNLVAGCRLELCILLEEVVDIA
jgi:hypothetical protein